MGAEPTTPIEEDLADLAVVIVLHDSGDVIGECVAALPSEVEVVLVDNASTDAGVEAALAARGDARVVALEQNVGFGAGVNAGARVSRGRELLILNPDARIRRADISILRERLVLDPRAMVGPALVEPSGAVLQNLRHASRLRQDLAEVLPAAARWTPAWLDRNVRSRDARYTSGGEVDYLQGACLLLRRDFFSELGGFDERFFLYSEEEDLCARVRAAGGRCLYEPGARAEHMGGTSSRSEQMVAYHLYRSRVLYFLKRDGRAVGGLEVGVLALVMALSAAALRLAPATEPRRRRRAWRRAAWRGVGAGIRSARAHRERTSTSPV